MPDVLYRAENRAGEIRFDEYLVVKKTPRGCWVLTFGPKNRFVLDTGSKRFAYPTKEEALASFIKRKSRQVTILHAQLEDARQALAAAKSGDMRYDSPYYLD